MFEDFVISEVLEIDLYECVHALCTSMYVEL